MVGPPPRDTGHDRVVELGSKQHGWDRLKGAIEEAPWSWAARMQRRCAICSTSASWCVHEHSAEVHRGLQQYLSVLFWK